MAKPLPPDIRHIECERCGKGYRGEPRCPQLCRACERATAYHPPVPDLPARRVPAGDTK